MKAVLVTGASTGIGRASALALSEMGFRVYAGVRKSSDGESLRKEAKGFLTALSLDVTQQEQIHAALREIALCGGFQRAGAAYLEALSAHKSVGCPRAQLHQPG